MTTYRVIAEYLVKPGNAATALPLLRELAQKSRTEPANLSFEVYQSIEDENRMVLVERYADADGFQQHRDSEHFQRIARDGIFELLEARVVETYDSTSRR